MLTAFQTLPPAAKDFIALMTVLWAIAIASALVRAIWSR